MKTTVAFFATFLIVYVTSAPVDPEDEVELIPALTTDERVDDTDEGIIPIVVITSRNPFLSGFPFFGPNNRQLIPPGFGALFGQTASDEAVHEGGEVEVTPGCGLLCTIFRDFEDQMRKIEEEIRDIRRQNENRENEIDTNESENTDVGFDVHNTTYSEKVLPDGTVVKVNRTVISDTSDDGSFFFHSTSFHNVGLADDEGNEEETVTEEDAPEEFSNDKFLLENEVEPADEDETENKRKKRSSPFLQQLVDVPHPNVLPVSQNNWKPIHDDIRVNDILTANGKRGNLIRIDPDSELIRLDETTGEIVTNTRTRNVWSQQNINF